MGPGKSNEQMVCAFFRAYADLDGPLCVFSLKLNQQHVSRGSIKRRHVALSAHPLNLMKLYYQCS